MVSSNTETNISVTYDDTNGKLNFASTDTNTTYSVGDGGLTQNNFTNTLKTKLDGIAASANVGITDVVGDTTPQLGGSLDVNGQDIVSTSNGAIELDPNGSGKVTFKGNSTKGSGQFVLNCEQNSHGIVFKGPPHSAAASYTFTLPDDIQSGKYLTTDASGNTSWGTPTNTTYSVGDGGLTTNDFTDADHTKLNGIEASADVTDATNVDAAGAVMNSDLATKGQILVGDGSGDPTALSVGTNDYVLTADSSEATGVKWAAASGGGGGGVTSDSALNTLGGTNAGNSITSGYRNTLFGYDAGTDITEGLRNDFYGYQAGANLTTGEGNCGFSYKALYSATTATTNVAVGKESLEYLSTGASNCALGVQAGRNITTGDYNIAFGHFAAKSTTTNSRCVGIGYEAMLNSDAFSNIAIGYQALKTCTSGQQNCMTGTWAGRMVTGSYNSAYGNYAMNNASTGSYNCAYGQDAMRSISTGSKNTALGYSAGNNVLTTGDNNTIIGYDARVSASGVDNEVTLGDSNISTLRCQVTSISSLSDERDKTDIIDLPAGLNFINKLRPVKFKWQTREGSTKDGTERAGFIAQDFAKAQIGSEYLDLILDTNPDKLEAKQGNLIPVLVKAIQELTMEVELLKANG